MREGIGSVMLYNIIIVFIVIIFAIIAGTLSYAKAFKVNSAISKALESYEGYNGAINGNGGVNELQRILQTLGYQINENYRCPDTWGSNGQLANTKLAADLPFKVCIYNYPMDARREYDMGIVTYLQVEIPVIGGALEVPIYSRTSKMYVWR